ncbi:glycosyltransferase family 2 protein [Pseudalkalibacillus caeni]|uniref:glycosyltransferase family 2 protein n=1 Tax=Exobacillus caeni TaxID=2574798 RepID=UPI0014858A70|nr:glycosyltransferase family 2 protein [Pseudalkalibacillus caeni]
MAGTKNLELLSIILSWNRSELLEKTIRSYLETVSVPHRLVVVDNASDPTTIECIKSLQDQYKFKVKFLRKNVGGNAFNIVLDEEDVDLFKFVHFSENDVEYLPGWDLDLISKFASFPELGQLSPFSPYPEKGKGEVWTPKRARKVCRENKTVYMARTVGTTCVVRKEIIQNGLRWRTHRRGFLLPKDRHFSIQIKKLGWRVAWNDRYVATNWGHNIKSFQENPDYYVQNYNSKKVKIKGFQKRLRKEGYQLIEKDDGSYDIKPMDKKNE